jgi:hypothetical protein
MQDFVLLTLLAAAAGIRIHDHPPKKLGFEHKKLCGQKNNAPSFLSL